MATTKQGAAVEAARTNERIGRFSVSYGTLNRLWCNACDKHETLPDLTNQTVQGLEASHACGPRTAPWDSPGAP
jgi:hypothetical protein